MTTNDGGDSGTGPGRAVSDTALAKLFFAAFAVCAIVLAIAVVSGAAS